MDTPYYTIEEAAKRLRKHPNTVRLWCQQGIFPHARKIGHSWYIPKTDVEPLPPEEKRKGEQQH